jgi:hypothetical protein
MSRWTTGGVRVAGSRGSPARAQDVLSSNSDSRCADQRAQIAARHALHDEVERAGRLLERRVQPRDAGVAQLAQHLGLALVQLERLPAGAQLDPLDHDLLPPRHLDGDEGLALAAAAERRADPPAPLQQRPVRRHHAARSVNAATSEPVPSPTRTRTPEKPTPGVTYRWPSSIA